jgi:hypothetical protein
VLERAGLAFTDPHPILQTSSHRTRPAAHLPSELRAEPDCRTDEMLCKVVRVRGTTIRNATDHDATGLWLDGYHDAQTTLRSRCLGFATRTGCTDGICPIRMCIVSRASDARTRPKIRGHSDGFRAERSPGWSYRGGANLCNRRPPRHRVPSQMRPNCYRGAIPSRWSIDCRTYGGMRLRHS